MTESEKSYSDSPEHGLTHPGVSQDSCVERKEEDTGPGVPTGTNIPTAH